MNGRGVSTMIILGVALMLIGLHYWLHRGSDWVLIIAGMMLDIGLTQLMTRW